MNNKWFCKTTWSRMPACASSACVVVWLACSPVAFATVPEWLRTAAQAVASEPAGDVDSIVLLDEQVTTIGESGEIKTLYRRAYKILRPEGHRRRMLVVHFDGETKLTYLKGWSLIPG